jgi:hypothetical protein
LGACLLWALKKNKETYRIFVQVFFQVKSYVLILTKNVLAMFWAIFCQTYLVTL